jgi:hypothetical protein
LGFAGFACNGSDASAKMHKPEMTKREFILYVRHLTDDGLDLQLGEKNRHLGLTLIASNRRF